MLFNSLGKSLSTRFFKYLIFNISLRPRLLTVFLKVHTYFDGYPLVVFYHPQRITKAGWNNPIKKLFHRKINRKSVFLINSHTILSARYPVWHHLNNPNYFIIQYLAPASKNSNISNFSQ